MNCWARVQAGLLGATVALIWVRSTAPRPSHIDPCSRWRLLAERQVCSGSGHSRPQRELTVSATFRSSRRQRDRDADDRSQGSADVARRMCVARWFPERQLNRCRGHWASKTNRMSAAHGAGLTHPTQTGPSASRKADAQRLVTPRFHASHRVPCEYRGFQDGRSWRDRTHPRRVMPTPTSRVPSRRPSFP